MIAVTPYYFSTLPWSSGEQENQRFKRILLGAVAVTLLFAMLVAWIELPEQTREEKAKVPPQLAKLIVAEPPQPVVMPEPEPVIPETIIEEKPEVEPEPEPIEVEPEPEPEPVVVEKVPEPVVVEPTQEEKVQIAKETAAKAGVMNFTDDLASLRDSLDLGNMADTQLTEGAGQQSETGRKLIGRELATDSGQLDTASLSTTAGARGSLAGRKTTEFDAPTEGSAALATQRVQQQADIIGDRSVESIRKTLAQNDGGLYSLYRRALRSEPELQGKLTVRLTIQPSGALSAVDLVGTDLASQELIQRLIARIRMISFGAQDVTTTEIEYTYNFLPF
ncbi:AgmX/PglI C-terminal domain-containing protein [Alteromonas facilis]|uniref:AgmX/PglI C-terminal domain-containing protein n=1 Tax=Alteromonas facilis TaxID=2048004 RepID=UPI000C286A26|nr:AgmX/PglI C-terminal domain-containing protein [Alteromonas facilis]